MARLDVLGVGVEDDGETEEDVAPLRNRIGVGTG